MLHLLFALLQVASSDRSLDDAAAAFAKGDASARDEIVKGGLCSILPLRKVRAQAPEKIDALLYELKTHADGAPAKALLDALDVQTSVQTGDVGFAVPVDELSRMFPLMFDPVMFRTHWDKIIKIDVKDRPRREVLESLCRQLGLDYGFFYGVVLIAAPERLWPAAPPPRAAPLTAEESARAVALIEKLASEKFQEREAATAALLKLGKGAIPLLEKGAQGDDAERRARCESLVKELTGPPPESVFHRPAASRQKLAGADDVLKDRLVDGAVSFKVQDIVLDGAMRLLLQPRQIPYQLSPALQNVRLTLDLQNHSSWAVIALATHCCGFDFLIQDGKVVIDTREEIQRKLAGGK